MNSSLNFFASLIVSITVFYACKKHEQVQPPPKQNHFIKVRIVEFGNNQTLRDVSISMRTPEYLNLSTDANGVCIFKADSFSALNIYKPGYWNFKQNQYPLAPLSFSPTIPNFDYGIIRYYSCDSFEVKLFPEIFVTIHLKDTSNSINDTCLFKLSHTSEYNFGGIDYVNRAKLNYSLVLRPAIDTTFQYPVFGNALNTFMVSKGCSEFDFLVLYQQSFMISGSSNPTLTIFY